VNVRLLLVKREGELLSDVPTEVPLSCLGDHLAIAFPFRLSRLIRFERPPCIISAFDDVNVMVVLAKVLARSNTSVLLSNHNTLSVAASESKGWKRCKYFLLRWLMPWAYRRANRIITVSHGVADDLISFLSISSESVDVIYNPVIDSDFESLARAVPYHQVSSNTVLFVGRLVAQKDVTNLLVACRILKSRQDLDVLIVGDGPQRLMLEKKVKDFELAGHVRFVGTVSNPLPLMAASGVLVLPSRFEGLGNVLIEAMACGTQVVSTDCPHGPAEILNGGRYGQLVPVNDAKALAAAIDRSLSGEFRVDPDRLRSRAADFSVAKATYRYLELAGYDVTTLPIPE